MIDWRALIPIAGELLKASATSGGPLAGAIVTFAVEAVEFSIDAIENGQDKVSVIEGMQTRIGKLLVDLEAL